MTTTQTIQETLDILTAALAVSEVHIQAVLFAADNLVTVLSTGEVVTLKDASPSHTLRVTALESVEVFWG